MRSRDYLISLGPKYGTFTGCDRSSGGGGRSKAEFFQPIPIREVGTFKSRVRELLDLQLLTIHRYLADILPTLKGKVLDVGAGESPWQPLLTDQVTYIGLDIKDADAFGMTPGRTDITYYDGEVFPFPSESFSSVLCIETLEHTPDPQKLLMECRRVLVTDGTLILTVPWSARRHHIPNDYFRFSSDCLRHLFESAGFSSVIIRERGSEYSVIANKLLISALGALKRNRIATFPFRFVVFTLAAVTAPIWILISRIDERMSVGSKLDPLGYIVTAKK